jgi:hypothetical protein
MGIVPRRGIRPDGRGDRLTLNRISAGTTTDGPCISKAATKPLRDEGATFIGHGSSVKPDARGRSHSPPTGFRLWRIHRHCRNEAIPVRHFDLRETRGVHHVVLVGLCL